MRLYLLGLGLLYLLAGGLTCRARDSVGARLRSMPTVLIGPTLDPIGPIKIRAIGRSSSQRLEVVILFPRDVTLRPPIVMVVSSPGHVQTLTGHSD